MSVPFNKIINWRTFSLPAAVVSFALFAGGCIFGNRQLTLKPVYTTDSLKAATASKVYIIPTEDARNNELANIVGHVRSGYGMQDVFADKNVDEWVQTCITENLEHAGFEVSTGKMPTKGLCVLTTIRFLEFDAYFPIKATVIIDVKLKKDNREFFSRSFTGKFSKPDWKVSFEEYQNSLNQAMKQCLDKMMPVLILELGKNSEHHPNEEDK